MTLAARIELEPARREAIGKNIRLIVTNPSCVAYDRDGNAAGKYTMVMSTDKLYWWARTDDDSEIGLTKMVRNFTKKGMPLKAESRLRLALEPGQHVIKITRDMGSDEETTHNFATFEEGSDSGNVIITTRNRVLEFSGDGRLNRSVYCYEFGGPYCEGPKTWDYHSFKYDGLGHVIEESGVSEGKDYHYKRDFELNENGDVIREGGLVVECETENWVWGGYRRILYFD